MRPRLGLLFFLALPGLSGCGDSGGEKPGDGGNLAKTAETHADAPKPQVEASDDGRGSQGPWYIDRSAELGLS